MITPIPIRHQEVGIVWDTPASELPPNAMSDGENVRIRNNRFERMGGLTEAEATTNARALYRVHFRGDDYLVRITTTVIEYTADLTTWTDITPVGGISDRTTWIVTQGGDWWLFTNGVDDPFVYEVGTAQCVAFSNWPANTLVDKLIVFKNFIVGVGVQLSGNYESGYLLWSDELDWTSVDTVEWAPAATNLAGNFTISTNDGPTVEAEVLRDSLLIYFDRSTWRMDRTTAVLAGVAQVFAFRIIFPDYGAYKLRCVVSDGSRHYVLGKTDIYTHDGNIPHSIADKRATNEFFSRIGTNDFVFLHHSPEQKEIWVAYAEGDKTYASTAFVYSYIYDAWTHMLIDDVLGDPQGVMSHIAMGPNTAGSETYATLDTASTTYADLEGTSYASLFGGTAQLVPYTISPEKSQIYQMDTPNETADIPLDMTLERVDLDLDEFFKYNRYRKLITRIYPITEGAGDLTIETGGRNATQGSVAYQPAKTFAVGDYKVDTRLNRRYPAIRITQNGAGNACWAGYDLEVTSLHGR